MSSVVKRSGVEAAKTGAQRRSRVTAPPPSWIPPQLSQTVEVPPSGPRWVHEIKLDGSRMSARVEGGRAQFKPRRARWIIPFSGRRRKALSLGSKGERLPLPLSKRPLTSPTSHREPASLSLMGLAA